MPKSGTDPWSDAAGIAVLLVGVLAMASAAFALLLLELQE